MGQIDFSKLLQFYKKLKFKIYSIWDYTYFVSYAHDVTELEALDGDI